VRVVSSPASLGKLKAGKTGVIVLKKVIVACDSTAKVACFGSFTITGLKKSKPFKAGANLFNFATGATAPAQIKLNRSGLKAVKKLKKLKVTITMTVHATGFPDHAVSTAATIKP
jgi:hypothetical protein